MQEVEQDGKEQKLICEKEKLGTAVCLTQHTTNSTDRVSVTEQIPFS